MVPRVSRPDARRLADHVDAMDPAVHGGLYPGLEVDVRTGLPTYKEWTRVQTDVALATGQLAQLGPRKELAAKAEGVAGLYKGALATYTKVLPQVFVVYFTVAAVNTALGVGGLRAYEDAGEPVAKKK